ncbi:MAG: hypothetical protein JW801_01840 [Bacteroidales bacterium]|nr:hypothetical protein [Bacteroidales bacterium]
MGFLEPRVDLVLTGHDHIYSRIEKKDEEGLYYIVNGPGGSSLYKIIPDALPADQFDVVSYNRNYGAMQIKARRHRLEMKFYSISNSSKALSPACKESIPLSVVFRLSFLPISLQCTAHQLKRAAIPDCSMRNPSYLVRFSI